MIRIFAGDRLLWEAFPIQERALTRREHEILFGGARGGTKTACGIAWLLMGNWEDTGTVADAGYYRHPQYRALVLRKNISDMGDWIHKAKQLYLPLGATFRERPPEFSWPGGGTIVIGHLDDEDAFEKYQGQEFARILIEELTQIKSKDLYLKVLASNRCAFDELKCQVFLTTNPGGPGGYWVRERFVEIAEEGEPFTDPETKRTRVFIPAKISDNPIYANDAQYVGTLMSLPPALRKAWLDGDWNAIAGAYFDEFRTYPMEGEPPEARHVIMASEARLEPWYHRWLSCDWGYSHNSAVYKYCQEPNGRVHVYDELVMSRTTPEELGIEIARFLWSELRDGAASQQSYQMFLSPDAFSRRQDERTIADQIAYGVEKVLGADSVYILPLHSEDTSEVFSRAQNQRRANLVIQRAANQRVPGWMYVKSMLRWWPLLGAGSKSGATPLAFDPIYAARLYQEDKPKWREYCALFRQAEDILPKLLVHGDTCPKLIRALPLAKSNDPDKGDPEDVIKSHWDGADSADSLRYGIFALKTMRVVEPFERFHARHMETYAPEGVVDGNSKVWMARRAEEKYKAINDPYNAPINFSISTARQRRRGRM